MSSPYSELAWEPHPDGRCLVVINMVVTIDGKTVSGDRSETVMDLGSDVDHAAMRDLESRADAVLIGAQTLRATPKLWYPEHLIRLVATHSGNLPLESRFFTNALEKAWTVGANIPGVNHAPTNDWNELLTWLSQAMGVRVLLVEGGSEINAEFLALDLVDEIFMTIAPVIKLGRETPTLAGGEPLARADLRRFELLSAQPRANEIFLRYRRAHAS